MKSIDGRVFLHVFDGGEHVATFYANTNELAIIEARRYQHSRGMEDAITDALNMLHTGGRVERGSIIHNELSLALKGTIYDEDGEGEPDNVVRFTGKVEGASEHRI